MITKMIKRGCPIDALGYEAPALESWVVEYEEGFAASPQTPDYEEDDDEIVIG